MFRPSIALAILLPSASLLAQDVAVPNSEPPMLVQPFAQLVGRWKAEGRIQRTTDAAVKTFTAKVDARWVLGGHFVQEDMNVSIDGVVQLQTRTMYGRDPARDRFIAASVANDGRSRLSEVVWTEANKLVAITREMFEGRPVLIRSVWDFDGARYRYLLERSTGDGAWQSVAIGTFEKSDEAASQATESAGGAGVGAEMARLAPMAGRYTLDAERLDAAGRTLVEASGTDTVRTMYGGQVLDARTMLRATDREFESHRYLAWDPTGQRYQVFSFDDNGGVGVTRLRWEDEDALVGEAVETDGIESVLASTRIEIGTPGIRRVMTRTVRGTGEIVDQVTLRYRRSEDRK